MMALIWKDWRQSRPLAIAAAVMYFLPAIILLLAGLIFQEDGGSSSSSSAQGAREDSMEMVAVLAMTGAGAATMVIPMFAAIAFARERRERTADFIGTLPVARSSIVASKLLVAAGLSVAPWLVSLMIAWIAGLTAGHSYITDWTFRGPWILIFTTGLMLFGCAWLLSALWRSEVMAAALGLLAGMLTVGAVLSVLSRRGLLEHSGPSPYSVTMAIVGVLTLAAGTIVAALRKSP